MTTIVTANLLDYDGVDPLHADRYEQLATLLSGLNPDILAVQELISSGPNRNVDGPATRRNDAGSALIRLAGDLEMERAEFVPAVAISTTRHHTGLLWREGIEVEPDSLVRFDSHVFGNSHGLVTVVVKLGGRKVRVGSVHFSHQDPGMSGGWKDAGVVMRAFNRKDGVIGVTLGDYQGIGADATYDPDPYEGKVWDESHTLHRDRDGNVDRDAAIRLEEHGHFRDCARLLGAPWQATTGHHKTDTNEPRRIDRVYVTHNFPTAAVTGFRVVDPAEVGQCTDHCPVVVEIDETRLWDNEDNPHLSSSNVVDIRS